PPLPQTSNNGITGSWNPNTISNTAGGTYVFTPDANQCATTLSIDISVGSVILITLAVSNTSCAANDGSITLAVTGGTPPYSYAWSGPGAFTSTLQNITNL